MRWDAIPSLAKQALEVLEPIEKPRATSAQVTRTVNRNGVETFLIQIGVDGARGSGRLVADARTGEVIEARRT